MSFKGCSSERGETMELEKDAQQMHSSPNTVETEALTKK